MTTRQTVRFAVGILVVLSLGSGCEKDPAQSVKIIARPISAARVTGNSDGKDKALRVVDWHPKDCPPLPENTRGPSRFNVTGPCAFQESSLVKCDPRGDDFIVTFTRKARGDTVLIVHINIEHYHGPGAYEKVQMSVTVEEGESTHRWYRWSTDQAAATVGPGESYLDLAKTSLPGEPLNIPCVRSPKVAGNYQYLCDGITDSQTAIESTTEEISGRLQCAKDN